MSFTPAQEISSAVTPKISAFLSILGSSAILSELYAERGGSGLVRGGRGRQYERQSSTGSSSHQHQCVVVDRVLVGLSVSDLFFSAGWFLTTWPAPPDRNPQLWGASGTDATCAAQGFVIQLGFWGTPVYNTILSLYYDLIITRDWKDERLLKFDRFVHPVLWTLLFANCIALASVEYFNSTGPLCWISSAPAECSDAPGSETPCERGDEHAWKVGIFEQVFPIYPCLLLNSLFMAHIYLHVRRTIMTSTSYGPSGVPPSRFSSPLSGGSAGLTGSARRQLRSVRGQALLYAGAMFFCLLPDNIYAIIWYTHPDRENGIFWLDTLSYLCLPLQGLLNFLIFVRQRLRKKGVASLTPLSRMLVCIFLQNPVVGAATQLVSRAWKIIMSLASAKRSATAGANAEIDLAAPPRAQGEPAEAGDPGPAPGGLNDTAQTEVDAEGKAVVLDGGRVKRRSGTKKAPKGPASARNDVLVDSSSSAVVQSM